MRHEAFRQQLYGVSHSSALFMQQSRYKIQDSQVILSIPAKSVAVVELR